MTFGHRRDIMNKVGEFICKNKLTLIILSLIFLVLSVIGYANTKINYDINVARK